MYNFIMKYTIDRNEIIKTLSPLRDEMIRGYTILNNFFIKRNLKWFPHAGTLLGIVRENGFVKWDDDMDMITPYLEFQPYIEEFIKYVQDNGFKIRTNFGPDAAGANIFLKELDLEYLDLDGEIIKFKHRPTIDLFFISPFPINDNNIAKIHKLYCYEAIYNKTYKKEAPGWIWTIKNDFMKNVEDLSSYVKNVKFRKQSWFKIKIIKWKFKKILNYGSNLSSEERAKLPHYFVHPEIYKFISIVPSRAKERVVENGKMSFIINDDYESELSRTYSNGKNGSDWNIIKYWPPYHITQLSNKLKSKYE